LGQRIEAQRLVLQRPNLVQSQQSPAKKKKTLGQNDVVLTQGGQKN